MSTKKIIFGLLACVTFLAVSCETASTADEDQLYENQAIDGNKIRRPTHG